MSISIVVKGIPAPQGSKRHVGGGRMVEMSRAVAPWREAVRAETAKVMDAPFAGAVEVDLAFALARPAGHFGTGRNEGKIRPSAPAYPAGKPDIDKLARAVLDGLTAGGAWRDDAQVVSLHVSKNYSAWQGCIITIASIDIEGVRL